jgi:hypothetical protein
MSFCEVCDCDPCDCHGMEKSKTTYVYVKYNQIYYVPRAPSLCEARVREEVFVKEFGDEPFIVGPFEWELLSTKYEMLTLEVSDV